MNTSTHEYISDIVPASNLFRGPSYLKELSRAFDLTGGLDQYVYSDDADQVMLMRDYAITLDNIRKAAELHGKDQD